MACKIRLEDSEGHSITSSCNKCVHPSVRWNAIHRKQHYCCKHRMFLVYYKGCYTNIKELIEEKQNIMFRDLS